MSNDNHKNVINVINAIIPEIINNQGKEFVDDNIPWVHFDIAGMAWGVKPNSINPKGSATGWGVRLVLDMLDV